MPHLTLEYTTNLDKLEPGRTLLALNQALVESGHFTDTDIKSRAIALDTWYVGTAPSGHAFAHVKLAILSGRSPEVKSALSASLLRVLRASCPDAGGLAVQLCVEVLDIDRASYAKDILNANDGR